MIDKLFKIYTFLNYSLSFFDKLQLVLVDYLNTAIKILKFFYFPSYCPLK